jgi:alkanesulfonate monooxygenase SsuD/methylene tetrahydromethanopterin reductase-like flavin-dependent oxidoreductase (luciferase family)
VAGHDATTLKVSIASHLHVAEESQAARDDFYPYYSNYFRLHAPKMNYAREVPRDEYDRRAVSGGPLFVGSPQEIIDKLMVGHELFGHQRFLAHMDIGGQPFAMVAKAIELLGAKVLPAVKAI